MDQSQSGQTATLAVRAYLLGARLEIKGFEGESAIAVTPLTLRVEGGGTAMLFRYGAAVLIDVPPAAEARLLGELSARVVEPITPRETEQAQIRITPDREDQLDPNGVILLQAASPERLQIVASALAKSVVLAHYEGRIAEAFDRIEPLADRLRGQGTVGSRPRDLLRQIGSVLKTQQIMVGRVEVEEEPEILWIHPEFKRLYGRLVEEYELRERARAIERKLDLVQDSIDTLLDLVQNQRSVRLEILVVLLIGIEILLSGFDILHRFVW